MLTLTAIADQSTVSISGHGWLILAAVLLFARGAYLLGREHGRSEARRAILRHPSIRARHADKRIRQAA